MKHITTKNYKQASGFTIIELIIVIVVIVILATITYVSYSRAQISAKTSSAKGTATALQHKIEAYGSAKGSLPSDTNVTAYTNTLNSLADSSVKNAGITIGTIGSTEPQTTVEVSYCTNPSSVANAGAYRIRYWDYTAGAPASNVIIGSYALTDCTSWQTLTP